MLNRILEKFLPCQKVISILLDQHAQAKEMNNNACDRLTAACRVATNKSNVILMQKAPIQ